MSAEYEAFAELAERATGMPILRIYGMGDRIRESREAAGLTIAEAAKAIGQPIAVWNSFERDGGLAYNSAGIMVATLLRVPFDWLLFGDEGLAHVRMKLRQNGAKID